MYGQSSLGECNSKDGIVPPLAHMPLGYNSDILFKYIDVYLRFRLEILTCFLLTYLHQRQLSQHSVHYLK